MFERFTDDARRVIEVEVIEVEVRAAGIRRIELNVFGDNASAERLSESLAYVEMARQMGKDLD